MFNNDEIKDKVVKSFDEAVEEIPATTEMKKWAKFKFATFSRSTNPYYSCRMS